MIPNKLSINQLSELTGKDRRTITTRLQNVPFEEGLKGAHLYPVADALQAIYVGDREGMSLDEARKRQAISQAELNETRNEELRRTRIPIEIVEGLWDSALQSFAATLKAARGTSLTTEKINELLGILRDVNVPKSW